MAEQVELFFDPMCPWAWMTSRWLLSVAEVRDIEPVFGVMSLSVLNEGRDDLPDRYKTMMAEGWGPVRVAIAVERQFGKAKLAEFYTAIGARHHHHQEPFGRDLYEAALDEAGLPVEFAAAADDATLDAAVRESHHRGMDPVGDEVGTPVIHAPDGQGGTVAFFGPIVSPAPTGEVAGRLYDGVIAAASYDGFFELKRSRTRGPIFE
jgi:hypothetical protein